MLACFLLLLEEQWDFDNNEDKSMASNATSHLNIVDLEVDHDAYISIRRMLAVLRPSRRISVDRERFETSSCTELDMKHT